jgi:prevent-host-death family protein
MTATTLGVFDAKNRFSELIDRAERGEETIVTRHGRVVARIAPPRAATESGRTADEVAAIVERFRALREDIRSTSGPVTQAEIKAWKQEGQR